jgi:hypothetical protein
MKEYHIQIMSIDPNDHHGRAQGDDHQKYGLTVNAKTEKQAMEEGVKKFKQQHGSLPIFWVKAFEV